MMVSRKCLFINQSVIVRVKKSSDCTTGWKSKGVYTSKLKKLYAAFLLSIKLDIEWE